MCCSRSWLGVQLPSVTSFQFFQTYILLQLLLRVGREGEQVGGGLTKRGRDWPTALAETAPSLLGRQAIRGSTRVITVFMVWALRAGCSIWYGQGPCLQGLTLFRVRWPRVIKQYNSKNSTCFELKVNKSAATETLFIPLSIIVFFSQRKAENNVWWEEKSKLQKNIYGKSLMKIL